MQFNARRLRVGKLLVFVSQHFDVEFKQYLNKTSESVFELYFNVHIMNSLSRREEETLLKTTKAYALRECDDVVKGRFSWSYDASD